MDGCFGIGAVFFSEAVCLPECTAKLQWSSPGLLVYSLLIVAFCIVGDEDECLTGYQGKCVLQRVNQKWHQEAGGTRKKSRFFYYLKLEKVIND